MSETSTGLRPVTPDWDNVTAAELAAYVEAENRLRASVEAQAITGRPDPGATIDWRTVALPGRDVPVRVHRPRAVAGPGGGDALPLVLHVHGGGFVGTAPQSDWVNSHLAAHLPAVVISVDHRLLDWRTPLAAAADDGWDVLRHVLDNAAQWGVDPARAVLFGESCGGLICALAAIRARDAGLPLKAQVLVNPAVEVAGTMFDHPSMTQYADTPTLSVPVLRLFHRLAVPEGTDARALSPLHADDLGGLAPALVAVPTHDPIADHGRRYAEALRAAGTPARLAEYPGAGHAFLSMPVLAPQAEDARADIRRFLHDALTA
ncbi:alpha/beta hydrolase [Nonomuraea sp. NPDC005692]|uniref:alpha/beta hydrolase n=1 Tax=Nonomuraea sp. NPDC005692 TaxID=3157168 RepID=UPI0033DF8E3E